MMTTISIIITFILLFSFYHEGTPVTPKPKDVFLTKDNKDEFITMIYKGIIARNPYYHIKDKSKWKDALAIVEIDSFGNRIDNYELSNQFKYKKSLIGYVNNEFKLNIKITIEKEIVMMLFCNKYSKRKPLVYFSKNDSLEKIVDEICKIINEINSTTETR